MLGMKKKRIIHPHKGQALTVHASGLRVNLADRRKVTAYQTKAFRVTWPGPGFLMLVPNQIREMRADYEDQS